MSGPGDVVQALDAPLADDRRNCPECHTPLVTHHEEVTVEDLPPQPRRVIKRIKVAVGKCPRCGVTARGQHPCMGSHQWGANAHQLGPRVLAHALALHDDSGLPLRKVPKVIGELLSLFLHAPEIEPTNNRAERGLRPVVIARKVSQCSKNERGARSYAVLRSIFETLRRRTSDVISSFTDLLSGKPFPSQVR